MKAGFTEPFLRHFKKLPETVKRKFEKQLIFLLDNHHHPSLRTKKYDEANNVWQARVDSSYRFYFKIQNDTYNIVAIVKHPK